MAHEEKPVGSFPKSEAVLNPSLKDRSLEELQEMIEWPHRFEESQAERSKPPEPQTLKSEPTPIEESTPEPAEEKAAPEPETTPEPEPTPEQDGEDVEAELLRARLEAIEAENKKMLAKISGRDAGEKGYIKQLQSKIKELEARFSQKDDTEEDYQEQEPVKEPRRPRAPSDDQDGLKTWAIRNAIGQAASQFNQSHPDLPEVQAGMTKYLTDSGYNAESVLLSNDPIAAEREVTRVLEEAYWHAKSAIKQAKVSELETKRASQMRDLEQAKKKAAISGSGSVPPTPPKRSKTGDLSLSELEDKMRALGQR